MPRHAKYVRILQAPDGSVRRVKKGGREVHGLHYRRTTAKEKEPERGIYYTYREGLRVDLGSNLVGAIRQVEEPDSPAVVNRPEYYDVLELVGEAERVIDSIALGPPGGEHKTLEDLSAARQKLHALIGQADVTPVSPSEYKLSDCLSAWRDFKAEQSRKPGYIDETVRVFDGFVRVVGDKPLNFLDQEDFEAFERYLNRTYDKRNDWYARRLKGIRAVLKHVAKKKKKWPLPAGWKTWFDAIERQPVVSSPTNKKKLPPELFKAMLAMCRKNAAIDVEAMPKDSQADKARRNRAWERKRNAVQFSAILHLSAQTGFGPEDICGLQWRNFVLDTRLPYVSFPRRKSEWKTGFAIPRQIPLLPATVQALLTWREYERPNDYVFRNAQRGQWVQDRLSWAFRQIRVASDYVERDPACWIDGDQKKGDIWSFKHLRNLPGNVAHEAGIEEWVAGAILGHVPSTLVGKRYTDDPKPEMLLHLVQAIGSRYF